LEWLFKIEESKDDGEWAERLYQIQLLRRRIEELRNTLCETRRDSPPRNESLEELRPVVESTPEEKRNAELDDLKAKLLGRKK